MKFFFFFGGGFVELPQEIKNLKRYYDQQKALNLKLKTMKERVIFSSLAHSHKSIIPFFSLWCGS